MVDSSAYQDTTQKKPERKVSTSGLEETFTSVRQDTSKFVDRVVQEAISLFSSDIFFEPRDELVQVRFRIDGVLYEVGSYALDIHPQIASRFKVLCSLDPTERRKVQEGQFTLMDYQGISVNFRVEIAQTVHGEMIVVRVHKKEMIVMDIAQLGFSQTAFENFQNILSQRAGLILVCGPTGCGKTTTLYSTVAKLNENQEFNVLTIEDPVEFKLEGVNQMQVQKETGFSFAEGLRTILRLSPDVVLVGEIRDRETAQIAVESGLTGHLVLSTLHAEDAAGAIFRLLDLGIENYLLNSSLMGIVSQRLVRRICPSCKKEYKVPQEELDLFKRVIGRPPGKLLRSEGCGACNNLGYKGRTGIFEVLYMDSKVRNLIRSKVNEDEFREKLVQEGFVTLLRDGLEKAEGGITTVSEVLKNSLRMAV